MSDVFPTNPSIGETANGRIWTGTAWGCPALLIDAPADGNLYGRINNTWQQALPVNGGELQSLLIDYDLTVLGNASIAGTLSVGGAASFGSTLSVASNATIGGNLSVAGNVTDAQLLTSNYGLLAGPGGGTAANQARVMVIATPASFGFWSNGDNMIFGYGDSSGNLSTGTIGGLMQISQNGDLTVNNDVISAALSVSGNATIGGTLTVGGVAVTSDERYKTNIVDCRYGLDAIKELRGKFYFRNGDPELGLLAQDVKRVMPEAVIGDKFLAINPMALIAVLANAVKDLADRVEALDGRISEINRQSDHGHIGHS